jgi:hypothetical protein
MTTDGLIDLADRMMSYAMELMDDEEMGTVMEWANAIYDYAGVPADQRSGKEIMEGCE